MREFPLLALLGSVKPTAGPPLLLLLAVKSNIHCLGDVASAVSLWALPSLRFFWFVLFATLVAYGGSQARGLFRATAASLHPSHSNARSEPCLWPTPQLTAMLDP